MKVMICWNWMKIKGDLSVYPLLRKIESGLRFFSHFQWISLYGSHMPLVSLLGIAGLVLAVSGGRARNLKLHLGRSASSKKQCFIPGLRNLGNNCFLNVVLQSLASCPSFRHFLDDVEDCQLSLGRQVKDLPLFVSFVTLFEELSTLQERRITLNPKNMMSAMQDYIPQFQLRNQQDASEALLHLLSCLRDELSESYVPSCSSIADVAEPTVRILPHKMTNHMNEIGRWRQQYLGPFDGILGSILSCQTCSSEIVMDFNLFHTLPLSLMSNSSAFMLDRFTLEDCIKRFLAPEHVENYFCSRCWHIAAIKYLSSIQGQQDLAEIQKVSSCSEQDSCTCRNMSSLQTLPWSNCFSRSYKQLSIAHCPQILCIHLQRTSVNMFGEPVKIQGHISFPMILDLSPFLKHEVGIQKQDIDRQGELADQRNLIPISYLQSIVNHSEPGRGNNVASQSQTTDCSDANFMYTQTQNKVNHGAKPSKKYMYRLVSVVEHFGRTWSGHYMVYRGVSTQMDEDDRVGGIDISPMQWFCISDSEVHSVTEDDVLGADASMLFYERI